MRRQNSAEQRYAAAFASAERGQQLERASAEDAGASLEAVAAFESAIATLSRLAVVESAAKRALVLDAVAGLRARVRRLERSAAYALARAMQQHAAARALEEEDAAAATSAAATADAYLSAADWYMAALAALPAADDSGERAAVKAQVEFVLDKVEQLKRETKVTAATHASDAFLQSRVSFSALEWPDPPPPELLELLEEEEEVEGEEAVAVMLPTSQEKKVASGAAYSEQELDVLRRSSLINGHLFVPWVDDLDALEQFDQAEGLFEDPDGVLPLSMKQQRKDAQWLRPHEFARVCGREPVMVARISAQVVKQDIVTDCSFVASLCIAAAYEQRFRKPLISNIIFPVHATTKEPIYNPHGKYVVKLWANGVPRKVVIDDLLPVSATTGQLLSSCTTRANELWVSLIEKAYLKLNGGYDFPGGNSGIDLFALTGWIPERVALADLAAKQKEDRLWAQLKSAFHFGDCIITMATGAIAREEARAIGLVPMHVYAVLNVYELVRPDEDGEDGERAQRLLQLKNPWRKRSWRGPFSYLDSALWGSAVGDELRAYQQQFYPPPSATESESETDGGDEDDGLFWIDMDSVKRYFESIYLNWNPALFPYRDVAHAHWPLELGPANDALTLGFNPQYSLAFEAPMPPSGSAPPASATVWVLLSRHVRVVERDDADDQAAAQQFLTLHVYASRGQRVFFSERALWRGAYSNNPHTLVSLDVDLSAAPHPPCFTLVASQYEKFAPLDFTISVFATARFAFRAVPPLVTDAASSAVVRGAWGERTAGGRPFFSTFMANPQYHVQLTSPAASCCRRLYVFLEEASLMSADAAQTCAPVNLRAALHTTERMCGLPGSVAAAAAPPAPSTRPKVLSSGEYRPGFAVLEIAGDDLDSLRDFVVVPSTFEPGVCGPFTLRVVSDPPNAVSASCREIPPEGFGMELTTLTGKWEHASGSAAGCSNYGCYTFNPKFLVYVTRECELFARLQVPQRVASVAAINVSIFESTADGALLLSSNPSTAFRGASSEDGVYTSGNPSGVVANKHGARVPAGWYIVLPSTFEPLESEFELKLFSSEPVQVRRL